MLSRVTAKNVGDVFLRHTVELVNACVDMELIICIPGPAFYRSCIFQPCIFSPAFSVPPLQMMLQETATSRTLDICSFIALRELNRQRTYRHQRYINISLYWRLYNILLHPTDITLECRVVSSHGPLYTRGPWSSIRVHGDYLNDSRHERCAPT